MKRLIAIVCLAALAAFSSAQAADAAGKVAVIDLQKIMKESKATVSIHDQVEKKRDQFQKDITKDEERLKKRDKELGEKHNVLSPEAFDKERKDFAKDVEGVQRGVQKKRIQLDRAYAKAMSEVQAQISEIVKGIAKENGISITFPASETLFYAENLDITDQVLKQLDQKLPKVTVKIEEIKE